jgi:LEA14-like dessication related protein
MHADISIVGYSKNDLKLQTKIDINNPNLFNLIVKDIKVVSETLNGKKFSSFTFEGGEVSGNNERSFSSLKTIELNGNLPRVLKNKITAEVGVIFFGIIEKNIPVELLVELSLDELLDDLEIPDIILHAGIKELLDDGILFNVEIEIDNPNNVELFVEDIVADLKTEEGINVGKINLKGGILSPRGKLKLDSTGNILFKALDAESINIDLVGKATANIAGISQSLNIAASAIIDVPSLSDLLNIENESFDFSLAGEFKIRARGIITTVRFKVYNPSKIPLIADNLLCSIYGATGDKKKFITQKEMDSCEIASKNEICINTKLRIPYIKLLTSGVGRIIPQWFGISIEGDFSFEETNQSIPISINGFVDPHVFT